VKKLPPRLLIFAALWSTLLAQHPKPAYDPETKEGLLIQHIQQEEDPLEKLHYMEQFSVQFPSNSAIAWVYDQLQPAYMKEKAWDEAMRIGEKRIQLEPDNLEAAKLSLKAAESKASTEDIQKWADCNWRIAARVAAKGGKAAADAQQIQVYAEYSLYNVAQQTTDDMARLRLLESLKEMNPKSPYVENVPADAFAIYKKLNQMDKAIALAQQTLAEQPDNVDMLMAISEYYFGKQEARDKIIANSAHLVEVLQNKPRPATLTEEDWQKKKTHMVGTAYYMAGISASFSGQYGKADQYLRAALPLIGNDAAQQASALYELGMSNYRMADSAPARAKDALAYWRRCATIKSNFQGQAMKNIEAVRAEFNLP
jgi:tetratricopeptide (TPR) repeat protein